MASAAAAGAAPEDQAAIQAWRAATDPVKKDELFDQLIRDGLFPPDVVNQWEVGLYPDLPSADEQFIPKLMRKREILDTKHEGIAVDAEPCRSTEGFELTPTQRFVSTFLSPRCLPIIWRPQPRRWSSGFGGQRCLLLTC